MYDFEVREHCKLTLHINIEQNFIVHVFYCPRLVSTKRQNQVPHSMRLKFI